MSRDATRPEAGVSLPRTIFPRAIPVVTVNIHCKYTDAGDSLGSGEGRAADGLRCVDRRLYPGWHVWISPNCENSIFWQCVDVDRAKPYQNLCACVCVYVTARLGLFAEVQPAGKYVKVCFETPSIRWSHRRKMECSKWFSQACRMFGVRGHIPLRLWLESDISPAPPDMCDIIWRWAQETGSDE